SLGSRIAGIRLWIVPTKSLGAVVRMQHDATSTSGPAHRSQRPAKAKGRSSGSRKASPNLGRFLNRTSRTSLFKDAEGQPGGFPFRFGPAPTELQPHFRACQEALRVLVTGSLPIGDGKALVKELAGAARVAPQRCQQRVLAQGMGQVVLEA